MSAHLAAEAERLKADELFNKALDDIRSEALESLAVADADDVIRLQQRVSVIDEIRATLDRYIIAADVQEQTGSYV